MREVELMFAVKAKAEKNRIVFYTDRNEYPEKFKFKEDYTDSEWVEILKELLEMANEVWPDIKPREATGHGSDFEEYYDKELDCDGWMSIFNKHISINAPNKDHERIYAITKRKAADFVNTLLKRITELEVQDD